jgi:hypothetical protein
MLSIQMDIENVIKENISLKEENNKLKTLLENYNTSRKSYYEKNKEIVNKKAKQRLKKIAEEDPERLKEINRKAYLKRKEKLQKLETTEIYTMENI